MADTTLRNKKTGEALFPETKARLVKTLSQDTVENVLQTLTTKVNKIESDNHYKGYHQNINALLSLYPNGNQYKNERAGWYARVGGPEGEDSTIYCWDVESSSWIKGATSAPGTGEVSVNNQRPNENGNISLNASDIPTSIIAAGKVQTVQEVLNDLKENGGSGSGGGSFSGDTLTLSKEVFVPGVPAKSGVVITGKSEQDPMFENEQNYGFRLAEDGWYESENAFVEGIQSFALCKIHFTIEEEMDVIFDVYNNGEQGCDFGYLSNLDTDLYASAGFQEDEDEGRVYRNFMPEADIQTEVIYESVPAGEHFISVKYRKDGSVAVGIDKIRFKLSSKCEGKEEIPSYTYVSSGSVKVGDNNNLQINGDTILTEKDKSTSFQKIIGTEENPIVLFELKPGSYNLSGKIKYFSNSEMGDVLIPNDRGEYIPGSIFIDVYPEETNSYGKLIYFYRGGTEHINIVTFTNQNQLGQIGNYVLFDEWGGVTVQGHSFYEYVNYGTLEANLNPIKFKVDNLKPIETTETLDDKKNASDLNKLFVKQDYDDESLYFTKSVGQAVQENPIETNKRLYDLLLDKSIVDLKIDVDGSVSMLSFDFGNEQEGGMGSGFGFSLTFQQGELMYITDSYGMNLYSRVDDYWAETGKDTDENKFNLTKYFQNTHYSWCEYKMYLDVQYVEEGWNANIPSYLSYRDVSDVLKTIKLANYDDLANAGGSENGGGIAELIGTQENPVILFDLERGEYLVTGYLKPSQNGDLVTISSYADASTTFPDYVHIEVKDMEEAQTPRTKIVYFYDCYDVNAINVIVYASHYSGGIGSGNYYALINETSLSLTPKVLLPTSLKYFAVPLSQKSSGYSNYAVLDTNNERAFTPTLPYHPATKIYVDNSVADNKPIKVIDDIENTTTKDHKNYFITNNVSGDESELFLCKGVTGWSVFPVDEAVDGNYVRINKDVLNMTLPDGADLNGTYTLSLQFVNTSGTVNTSSAGRIQLKFVFGSGMISQIYMYCNYKTFYCYKDGNWENEQLWPWDASANYSIEKQPQLIFQSSMNSNVKNETSPEFYLKDYIEIYSATVYKEEIALKKDIKTENFVPSTRKINGKTLDTDINLTAEDLGISFEGEPTIQANDGILTIQKNGTQIGTFSANQSDSSTINIEVPTTTSQLTNNSGFLTPSSSAITELGTRIGNLEDAIPYLVVNELPATGAPKTMYLLTSRSENQNVYDEYLWVNDKWEQVGKDSATNLPIYEKASFETFTFFNNSTLKPGVYLLKGGAEVYYGHNGYQSSSSYSFRLTAGSTLIYQKTQDWNTSGGFGQGTFQAFDGTNIYTGNTNYYSSNCSHFPMPAKYTSDGKSTLNRVPKIVDSNGTMQWIEPEYYTKTQTETLVSRAEEKIPTKVSDLINDSQFTSETTVDNKLSDIITRLDDLESNVTFIRVSELPATGANNAIYLLNMRSDSNTIKDGYDEYVWISDDGNPHWEKIGSNYATKGSLGTQVTYTLSGTTLTITPK